MSGLFNPDNPIMRGLSKLYDIVYLNLLWLLFSIPIITIGASTTALYYTSVKVIRRDRGYVFREFFKSFRLNFGTATIMWLIMLAVGVIFYGNMSWALYTKSNIGRIFSLIYLMMIIVCVFIGVYLFPVLSRFTVKVPGLIKNSFAMSIKHLPSTILMTVITVISIEAIYFFLPLILLLPALSTLLFSLLMERILKKYTPKPEEGSGDEWYLE